jgi:hypothetical protein
LSKHLIPLLLGALLVGACGRESKPATDEELERTAQERAAALEAAERNILNAGLPLPAENNVAEEPITNQIDAAANTAGAQMPANASDRPR